MGSFSCVFQWGLDFNEKWLLNKMLIEFTWGKNWHILKKNRENNKKKPLANSLWILKNLFSHSKRLEKHLEDTYSPSDTIRSSLRISGKVSEFFMGFKFLNERLLKCLEIQNATEARKKRISAKSVNQQHMKTICPPLHLVEGEESLL